MLTAERLPAFDEKTATGVLRWWNSMLDLGFFIHPEDDPADTVNQETGGKAFDDTACQKISAIHDEMISVVGYEETYDAGMTAFMNRNGWVCNATNDGWIEAETHKINTSWSHKTVDFLHYSPNHSPSSLT
jgi:hypothetical protein